MPLYFVPSASLWNVCECEHSQAHTKNGRTIKQINQVATCHSLVLSISKLITSFNEDKRFVCSCLSVLPVRLSAAYYINECTCDICIKIPQHVYVFCVFRLLFVFHFNCPDAVLLRHNEFSLVKWRFSLWSSPRLC